MTETELEYQFCFNCNDRKQCYTKPKDCTRIQEEIGLQEMTNEEYIQTCNTEQLAELLLRFYYQDYCMNTKRRVIEWLKQPHKE